MPAHVLLPVALCAGCCGLLAVGALRPGLPRVRWTDGLAAALAAGVLAVASLGNLNPLATGLATGCLAVVMLRVILTFRHHTRTLQVSRREALTDALTGLGNRRRLLSDLRGHLDPKGDGCVLMLFDLNGFKAYNDAFGHAAGDQLLVRLGRALAEAVGPEGRAYRFGGDEFCALVPGRRLHDSEAAALQALSEDGRGFSITAAHGVARIPVEASTASSALKLADQRMYAAKYAARTSRAVSRLRDVLGDVLEERERGLGDHADAVARQARRVGRRLDLADDDLDDLAWAAWLHDIGMAAVPDAVLAEPGPLSDEAWRLMRQHTVIGERILSRAPALRSAAALVRASHERLDGQGYPDGLKGDAIPLGARVVAVCDAFDALTAGRPHRPPVDVEAALDELLRCAGTQFDRRVVEALVAVMAEDAPAHVSA